MVLTYEKPHKYNQHTHVNTHTHTHIQRQTHTQTHTNTHYKHTRIFPTHPMPKKFPQTTTTYVQTNNSALSLPPFAFP